MRQALCRAPVVLLPHWICSQTLSDMCHFLYSMGDEVEALRNELASLMVELDLESGQSDSRAQACSTALLRVVSQSPRLIRAPHPPFLTIMC